jgi:hypothetical protein
MVAQPPEHNDGPTPWKTPGSSAEEMVFEASNGNENIAVIPL